MRYLEGVVVTQELLDEAEPAIEAHFTGSTNRFNRAGWQHIIDKHGGRLPVTIRAVPEGSLVTAKNAMMTIENTDPECYWLTNYLETILTQVWCLVSGGWCLVSGVRCLGVWLSGAWCPSRPPFCITRLAFRVLDVWMLMLMLVCMTMRGDTSWKYELEI
jgi:hypothetical protein